MIRVKELTSNKIAIRVIDKPIKIWFKINEMYGYDKEFILNDFKISSWDIPKARMTNEDDLTLIEEDGENWIRVNKEIQPNTYLYINLSDLAYPSLLYDKEQNVFSKQDMLLKPFNFLQLCEMYNKEEKVSIHLVTNNFYHNMELQFIKKCYPLIYNESVQNDFSYEISTKAVALGMPDEMFFENTNMINKEKIEKEFNEFKQFVKKPLYLTIKLIGENINEKSFEIN